MKAPPTLDHRYLHEDVGWGLVQWINVARLAHVPTPTLEALTTLAGVLNGVDYYVDGLTIERMGMADITGTDVAAYAQDGPPQVRGDGPNAGDLDRAATTCSLGHAPR